MSTYDLKYEGQNCRKAVALGVFRDGHVLVAKSSAGRSDANPDTCHLPSTGVKGARHGESFDNPRKTFERELGNFNLSYGDLSGVKQNDNWQDFVHEAPADKQKYYSYQGHKVLLGNLREGVEPNVRFSFSYSSFEWVKISTQADIDALVARFPEFKRDCGRKIIMRAVEKGFLTLE